jgi:hypothetical protein
MLNNFTPHPRLLLRWWLVQRDVIEFPFMYCVRAQIACMFVCCPSYHQDTRWIPEIIALHLDEGERRKKNINYENSELSICDEKFRIVMSEREKHLSASAVIRRDKEII